MKLTEKQKRFVDFYVETGNASESARRAGYSPKTAFRAGQQNMQKYAIQAAIKARLDAIESTRIATATEVMQFLTSAMRGEVQEEVPVIEGTGKGYSDARIIKKQLSAEKRNGKGFFKTVLRFKSLEGFSQADPRKETFYLR